MFSQSPLENDELLNKRIKNLRDTNFKNFLNNYEKNNREIISNNIKKKIFIKRTNYFWKKKYENGYRKKNK